MASWWNGRHDALKKHCLNGVKVQILLGLPLIFACAKSAPVGVTQTYMDSCVGIDTTPDDNEEWSAFCYCQETEEDFTKCIDDWYKWNRQN